MLFIRMSLDGCVLLIIVLFPKLRIDDGFFVDLTLLDDDDDLDWILLRLRGRCCCWICFMLTSLSSTSIMRRELLAFSETRLRLLLLRLDSCGRACGCCCGFLDLLLLLPPVPFGDVPRFGWVERRRCSSVFEPTRSLELLLRCCDFNISCFRLLGRPAVLGVTDGGGTGRFGFPISMERLLVTLRLGGDRLAVTVPSFLGESLLRLLLSLLPTLGRFVVAVPPGCLARC
mmetsp:Transcript_9649/g.27450  ORF Transcript_9649/g.27450 Transcript_9649/m.27450 type:complete len:230 (-) Transcript_9649:453-1142(-)